MASNDDLKMAIYWWINQVMVITLCLILFCTVSWTTWKRRTRTCRQRSRGWNRKLRICDCLKVKAWTFEINQAKFLDILDGVYVCMGNLSHVMCYIGVKHQDSQNSFLAFLNAPTSALDQFDVGVLKQWHVASLIHSVCFFICKLENNYLLIFMFPLIFSVFTWFTVD